MKPITVFMGGAGNDCSKKGDPPPPPDFEPVAYASNDSASHGFANLFASPSPSENESEGSPRTNPWAYARSSGIAYPNIRFGVLVKTNSLDCIGGSELTRWMKEFYPKNWNQMNWEKWDEIDLEKVA